MKLFPELRGKAAVVTGGNTGIGAAIARALAEQGVDVAVVAGHKLEEAERLAEELRALARGSFGAAADLTRGAEAERVVRLAVERLGKFDILVNCAGGFPARRLLGEIGEEEWDAVIGLNLKSSLRQAQGRPFLCSKAVLPGMIERRWGRIVNISSEAARMPLTLSAAHYAAGKAGLLGLTRHLAREVAPYGITVNASTPSTTNSERARGLITPEAEEKILTLTPIGRIAETVDQAGVVVFLASEAASYITGATVDVTGGKVMA